MCHLARGFALDGQHLGVRVWTAFANVTNDQSFRATYRRIADRVMVDLIRAVSGAAVAGVCEEPSDVGFAFLVRLGRTTDAVGRRQYTDAPAAVTGATAPH